MTRQTRSTTKAAAASSRPKEAIPGAAAASTRPQRRLPRPSQRSPQSPQHNKAAARKPKVPRTKQQSRKEKVRKRGGTIIKKGIEIADEGDTESFVAYKDPNLGWDGIVCLKDTPVEALGEIILRLHERGPLERRRGRRKKTHPQVLVGVPDHDDGDDAIEVGDEQGEHDDDDVDDDELIADADLNNVHGGSGDANDNAGVVHAPEDRGVRRDTYSFEPQTPLCPLGRPQVSESDVPALEPSGSSSPRRSESPEVDAAIPETPTLPQTPNPPAVDNLNDLMEGCEWMQMSFTPGPFNTNGELDDYLYGQMAGANAPATAQTCATASGVDPESQQDPYPAAFPTMSRPCLDLRKEALIAEKMQAMSVRSERILDLLHRIARGDSPAA